MKRRTVLFFDHTARLGGGEIALWRLATNLDPDRFTPVVLLGAEGELHARLTQAGIETHIIPLAPEVANTRRETLGAGTLLALGRIHECWSYAHRLADFIRHRGGELLHTNSLKADIIGAVAARAARIPVVWHVRDHLTSDYLPGSVATGFRILCDHVPTHVFVNSRATMQTLGNRARHKATVIYDGLPAPTFAPAPIPTSPPIIGIVGRISPWKGQHIFLKAAQRIAKRFPKARFRIIGAPLFGEENYEQKLHRLIEELGLQNAVEFTGFLDDMKTAIENLTVVVHASTLPEPFGQVVFEAMYYSRPVVAVRAGGVPEIVDDQVTGILVPPADEKTMAEAIETLLCNPKLATEMGAKGREHVAHHFRIKDTARKAESIFENLLG